MKTDGIDCINIYCDYCQGDGDVVFVGDDNHMHAADCELCDGVGNLSEDRLKEKLGEAEAGEILDLYYRRGEFKGLKPPPVSPFVKGFDA